MSEEKVTITAADVATLSLPKKVLYEFVPTESFGSPEFKSQYEVGLTYSVKEGNNALLAAAQEWAKAGRVVLYEYGKAPRARSKVSGAGEVSGAKPVAKKKK